MEALIKWMLGTKALKEELVAKILELEAKIVALESNGYVNTKEVAQNANENLVAIETSAANDQCIKDVKPSIPSDPNDNQVSKVKHILDTHHISTIDKKDTSIADIFHLKLENIKSDKVGQELSSNEAPSVGDNLPSLDDDQEFGGNQASEGMINNINASKVNPSKKNDASTEKKNVFSEKNSQGIASGKRKHEDKETLENNEPMKRQRRCNRFNSTNGRDTQKERIVLPSQKPTTNSLRIDRFLRPFTLNAVKELLGKTGTMTHFWMDQIKTHCFVTYSSVEEAVDTRNALYNLQWPPNGGRLLVAEFVDCLEVVSHLEAPPSPAQASTTRMPSTPVAPIQTPGQNMASGSTYHCRRRLFHWHQH